MLIDTTQLHFQGTAVNFVIFKCFSACFRHGAPNYRNIPYPENVKSNLPGQNSPFQHSFQTAQPLRC
jgi:hypothetical protein